MRLSISTLPFREWEPEKVLEFCARFGYEAIEIRMDYHTWSMLDAPDSHYQGLYEQIRTKGLCVSNLGSGIVLGCWQESALQELRRCFEIADLLQTKGVRIMLGYVRKTQDTPKKALDLPGIERWLLQADQMAERLDKEVWIETHNEFSSGRSLVQLIDALGLRHVRVIWDVMHPLEVGETVEQTVQILGERLVHVHIKDGLPWNDPNMLIWKYTKICQGEIPLQKIIALLQAKGYNGYYSLEWESAWRPELTVLHCDQQEMEQYPQTMKMLLQNRS